MCGIAGLLNLNGASVDARVVERMTQVLSHRGPDGEGIHIDDDFGVGHRRLAIIDLSDAAAQPMFSADRRYAIGYNGELYNYRDLRQELRAQGRTFRSQSDVEVVLQSLEEWGLDALNRFNGMFAFALWDAERRELVLARDRYGIKPLYLARIENAVLFGSEVKALMAHPRLKIELDELGLAEYLTFQNLYGHRTLLSGISLLPAGSWQRVSARGDSGPVRWWDFEYHSPSTREDDAFYIEELERLFTAAVHRQLVSDVGVNSYLSGGMDTGAITAIASSLVPDMKTFTVGFDVSKSSEPEFGYDERRRARLLARLADTEHHETVVYAADLAGALKDVVWHLEEPRVGQSYPNHYAAKLASEHGKVVLSGTGGDELFGGYPWRYQTGDIKSFDLFVSLMARYWQRLLTRRELEAVLSPTLRPTDIPTAEDMVRTVLPGEIDKDDPWAYVNLNLYFEAKTFLHGLLLVEDKLSMAHGLETRVPFLDNGLVDFAVGVPVDMKLSGLEARGGGPGASRGGADAGKVVLREVLERHVPKEIVTTGKQGFSGPDAGWFRFELRGFLEERLLKSNPVLFEILDPKVVRSLVEDHTYGRANRRLLMWSLLYLDEWCHVFLNGRLNQ